MAGVAARWRRLVVLRQPVGAGQVEADPLDRGGEIAECAGDFLRGEDSGNRGGGGKVRDALKKQELDLAEMQKTALEKTRLADEKLASVTKLEEENTNLKAALDAANQEVSRLKSDKTTLNDKASELKRNKNDLEAYLGGLAKKLFLMLEEFFQNFEEETGRLEVNLGPINSPLKDEVTMNPVGYQEGMVGTVRPKEDLKNWIQRN
ncbi:uncharacterized protein [Triticum aestivum]|uniref:uncharacterized protein n=1 Tax=Triticum aestivum TaxID=4565 RepID=UPI001D01E1DB|nr:uncharacterized protein LOC123067572 [Triticum aestivum]